MPGASLPVDLWLLVFAELDDLILLWSHVRNVSRLLRAYVDLFFRHGVVRNTFVDLLYSDLHTLPGPLTGYVHVPMVFDRWSEDGSRAIFLQRAYKDDVANRIRGSVRGWVPFIERYHNETKRGRLEVLNKSRADVAPPLWEREHMHWRNTLRDERKKTYLLNIGNMTSIGRGDRPPFYIKVFDRVNDTDLVDIKVDCAAHELSFDWGRTLSLFFQEEEFVRRASEANHPPDKLHVYDKELDGIAIRYRNRKNNGNHELRARQKRLMEWTKLNKHRMSSEYRMWTQERAFAECQRLVQILNHENLAVVPADGDSGEEIVPDKCADDRPELMWWPWADPNGFYVQPKRVRIMSKGCCAIL
jgi:hypothetical protein